MSDYYNNRKKKPVAVKKSDFYGLLNLSDCRLHGGASTYNTLSVLTSSCKNSKQ